MPSDHAKRSFTGHHALLPASRTDIHSHNVLLAPMVPPYAMFVWTFGRGSVIWRIWPAVLFHTAFAAAIVSVSMTTKYNLEVPNVMMTVLGVVIGFVISYRAGSGYDRYWMGRTAWTDIVKNSRIMGRLIWFHVPPRLGPKTQEEIDSGTLIRTPEEKNKIMSEKRMALDLIEGYCVALKHHLRGELGIYFEDLYHLVRPLHDHDHPPRESDFKRSQAALASGISPPTNADQVRNRPNPHTSLPLPPKAPMESSSLRDPIIPPINAYGTFNPSSSRRSVRRSHSNSSSRSSRSSRGQPVLCPAAQPTHNTVFSRVSGDLIPFASVFDAVQEFLKAFLGRNSGASNMISPSSYVEEEQETNGPVRHRWSGPVNPIKGRLTHAKHRPRVAGGGENLPLACLRLLSDWCATLEDRGTVPGTSLGSMIGCIATFEDSLSTLEKILTTPLPYVYSVHINTVWLYLFFLPVQLVTQFGWYSIPGVCIASFIYLGFVAAGEEIEQPFGYDENDLDLDLICRELIHVDLEHLKGTPGLNAYLPPRHSRTRSGHRTPATSSISIQVEAEDLLVVT